MIALAQRLLSSETVIGSFVGLGHPTVVELAGCSGFDFVVIDMEHSCINLETVENMARAAAWAGIDAIVRVPHVDGTLIGALLDAGIAGVQVPQVTSREYAEMAVAAAKYPPVGTRGYMPVSRSSRFLSFTKEEHIRRSNAESVVIAQVEGIEGLENIERILGTPGLNVVFLGPYDLSMSLGFPGQVDHPSVQGAIDRVIRQAKKMDVRIGIFADDPTTARRYIEQGVSYVTVGLDATYLTNAYKSCISGIKSVSD